MNSKKVAVLGAAGFAGIELVRHILNHPHLELVYASSNSDSGKALSELYPALLGKCELRFVTHAVVEQAKDLDAVFLAVPHTAAMEAAPKFLAKGVAVFDLSADFRLKDPAVYEQWYGVKHTAPELLATAVYGLPEINRSLMQELQPGRTNVLVACPGCYPTASALAVAPALVANYVTDAPVIINAISGVSGAGRTPSATTHYCLAGDNLGAYGATTHRHTPEIAQFVAWEAARKLPVVFTPHLAPLKRGLLSTATLCIKEDVSAQMLNELYASAYADEPFVQVLAPGQLPKTANVVGTNHAHVGIVFDENARVLIASCAIDNLGKGAAAQVIQCANIVFGYDEDSGISAIAGLV